MHIYNMLQKCKPEFLVKWKAPIDPRLGSPSLSLVRVTMLYCVLGQDTLLSALLHPGVQMMGANKFNAGGNPALNIKYLFTMDLLARCIYSEILLLSHLMPQKPG